jgi:hypothetical protein
MITETATPLLYQIIGVVGIKARPHLLQLEDRVRFLSGSMVKTPPELKLEGGCPTPSIY